MCMNCRLLLTTPLFPYVNWGTTKKIFLRWVKNYQAFFVPLTFHKTCKVLDERNLRLYCELSEIERTLRDKSRILANKVANLCKIAEVKNNSVKLVFHTEYQCMIWNWHDLLRIYSESIIIFINSLKSRNVRVDLVELEFHPGFAYTRNNNNEIELSNSRQYLSSIVQGMSEFILNVMQNTDVNLRVTIECRGSSIFRNVPQIVYETLALSELISELRRELNRYNIEIDIGFTADPWQEIGYKYKNYNKNSIYVINKIFKDIYDLIDRGTPLHDIHIHWNAHKIPSQEIFNKFLELINRVRSSSQDIIFVTPEIVRAESNELRNFLLALESIIVDDTKVEKR